MSPRVHKSSLRRDAHPSAATIVTELVDQLRVAGVGLLRRLASSTLAWLDGPADHQPGGAPAADDSIVPDHCVVQELAKVFCKRERSELLLSQAGFPTAMLPLFTTPQVFWDSVARDAQNGALHGGLMRIVMRASELFPANPVFARYLEENGHALRKMY